MKIFTKPSAQAEVMIQWDPLACMAIVYELALFASPMRKSVIQLHWFAARLMLKKKVAIIMAVITSVKARCAANATGQAVVSWASADLPSRAQCKAAARFPFHSYTKLVLEG